MLANSYHQCGIIRRVARTQKAKYDLSALVWALSIRSWKDEWENGDAWERNHS